MAYGNGPHLWDIDKNRYVGYLLSYGAVILGHGHPAIARAIEEQLFLQGTSTLGAPHKAELAMARILAELYPSAERMRFTNSGLEATLLCLRLAAAHSGRAAVAKFEGHYHGGYDQVLVSYAPDVNRAGDDTDPVSVADSKGIPAALLAQTVTLPWNDWESTERILRQHSGRLSAVILEPVMGGYILPKPEFLERLRALTSELGIILIFDEDKTGFRVGLGGAQARFGVTPDLTALGKILGGGFPIGAAVGSSDIMKHAVPGPAEDTLFHSGTFNGHAMALAAGLAVITELASRACWTGSTNSPPNSSTESAAPPAVVG